ncbi:bZIP transcription factor [Acinetobacter baumannii]|uniref:bZIP transcription factor n=1 Tax=Acinetobacter baumannii TaxID=470 RepID=UPI0029347A2E|nr:bZIP transcription factor [Acinetobacter baumannii]WOE34181.1 bZIP transcription factor [Acinetobacter baumannii]
MKILKLILIMPILVITGCSDSISRAEHEAIVYEKDQKIAELEEHITELEAKLEEVNNQFERFESENWRDVVPDVDNALDDLNSEVENNPSSNY